MRTLIIALSMFGSLAIPAAAQPPFVLNRISREDSVEYRNQQRRMWPRFHPASPQIQVDFQGESLWVMSSHDVSNVVLEYYDGTRQKFDDLDGRQLELQGTGRHEGKEITRAWIKSAANLSGDGPGYGQRFDRPRNRGDERTAALRRYGTQRGSR